ncbi:MAG: flagellin FlaB [Haloarculaceae archaeon]|jgi:flagellin FlaB
MDVKLPHNRDRGQVGIGTLIVFIAMVLVAAIAAGVLINTAGFLQSQSEQTGQQSSSQVSDRLQVVNVVGDNIDSQPSIEVVNLTVKKAPGAGDIDLATTTMQWVSDEQVVDIVHKSEAQSGATNEFGLDTVTDDDTSISTSQVLTDQQDRALMVLDIGSSADDIDNTGSAGPADADTTAVNALTEGQTADIEITTQAGGSTTVTLVVPDSLSGKTSVAL